MTPQSHGQIRDQIAMALLVSVATVLHIIEGFLPPLPLPGAKLGLANIATLVALRSLGFWSGIGVALLRSILGGLLSGNLFGPAFWMGFFGALSSGLVMALLIAVRPKTSNVTASILGAIAHSTAQILTAVRILHHSGLWGYWPVLTLVSGLTGLFSGLVADRSLKLANHWRTNQEVTP